MIIFWYLVLSFLETLNEESCGVRRLFLAFNTWAGIVKKTISMICPEMVVF